MIESRRVEGVRATLRRAAFEALYGPFAWAYDWVSAVFFLGQWRRWQRVAIHFLQGPRVLEIGMGTGNLHIDLKRAGYQVWGIDLSPQMLRRVSRKAPRAGLGPFNICRARAQALPFPGGAFDSVVSTFPSEYIADPLTLAEIARVLRPGGRLVVVPAGWLRPAGARGRAVEGVAKLVYGNQVAGPPGSRQAAIGDRQALPAANRQPPTGWGATLGQRMAAAGFNVSMHVASNRRGAALVVVAVWES
ncbi:MAG: class I SAM-dependent methyltransferase [Chloroflexia bacterium]